jgi:hypothetical protein
MNTVRTSFLPSWDRQTRSIPSSASPPAPLRDTLFRLRPFFCDNELVPVVRFKGVRLKSVHRVSGGSGTHHIRNC